MLDAALACVDRGWRVFPLRPRSKLPATTHGFHAATDDPEVVRAWWTEHPDLNIGVACGPSGLVVVDVDVKGDTNGLTDWYALVDRHGRPWHTRICLTPSAGEHWYYTADGATVRNSAGRLSTAVDVRADGGYVVVPPSVTPDGVYIVEVDLDPAPLPDWLRSLLVDTPPPVALEHHRPAVKDNYAAAALEGELGRLALATAGSRNHNLNTAAFALGQLVGAGLLDARDVADALLTVATRIGLGEREAAATVASGLRAGVTQPRKVA